MKIDINNRAHIIEVRNVYQINLTIDDTSCSLRREETHSGYELYVLFHDIGMWIDILDVKDDNIRHALERIGFNIELDMFNTEVNDIDITTLPKSNLLK